MPDSKFPFPFAKLNGCRIAIPDADSSIRQSSAAHLKILLDVIHDNPELLNQQAQTFSFKGTDKSGKGEGDEEEGEDMEDLNSEPPNENENENDNQFVEESERDNEKDNIHLTNSSPVEPTTLHVDV